VSAQTWKQKVYKYRKQGIIVKKKFRFFNINFNIKSKVMDMTWQSEMVTWIDKQEKEGLSTNKFLNMTIVEVSNRIKKQISEGKNFDDIYNYIKERMAFFAAGQQSNASRLASHIFKLAHDKMWSLKKFEKIGEQDGVKN